MVTPVRIVFFGTPRFAVPTLSALLDSRHQVVGVVTQPDRPRGRGQRVTAAPVKALAVERGLPVLQPPTLRGDAITAERRTQTSFRLSFSLLDPDELDEAVKRLARAVREVRRRARHSVAAPMS